MEPERQPDGPPDSVRAAAAALRSRRHAEMLFDAVAACFGDAAWQETANAGALRRLFRRDPVDPSQIEIILPPAGGESGPADLSQPPSFE